MAEIGRTYLYSAPQGVAELHTDGPLHPEMRELDLPAGTPVTVVDVDADRNLVLAEWTDSTGTARTTSFEPGFFAEHFQGEGGQE